MEDGEVIPAALSHVMPAAGCAGGQVGGSLLNISVSLFCSVSGCLKKKKKKIRNFQCISFFLDK